MNNKLITLESKKYELRLDNFEGPLDLLCYLIDKNKMDIYKVNIDEITDQYIEYIKEQEKLNLEVTSEFLIMASTLILLKSKGLLPKETEDEAELTEEELLRRIIEYKKYKEISKLFKERLDTFSKRIYKKCDEMELPKQTIEKNYTYSILVKKYKALLQSNEDKKNENAKNIEKIAVHDVYTVTEKVKEIYRELLRSKKVVFGKLFSIKARPKAEVVTAFSGVLELSRRSKVYTTQDEQFGEIIIEKRRRNELDKIAEVEQEEVEE